VEAAHAVHSLIKESTVALKFIVEKLEDVTPPLREHYTKGDDGKFRLTTEGEHPKVTEFRETNTRLMGEVEPLRAAVKKFEGIDPEAVKADRARLAELEKVTPRITELELELAAEKAARATAQQQTDALVVESTISSAFLKAGGLPKARAFIVAAALPAFTVEGGDVKGKKFSPNNPGQPMTVDEWLILQIKENSFCFAASSGGGADPKSGGGSSGVTVLKDPSARELGDPATAKGLREGKVRLEFSS
jgi:hypothetical protein